MPNDSNTSDRKLSELLSQAEPPKSPDHLDEAILRYAAENVPGEEEKSTWHFLSAGSNWLNQHWVSALTTVSVAVIAVSISLQNLRTDSEPVARSVSSPAQQIGLAPSSELAETDSFRPEQEAALADATAVESNVAAQTNDTDVAQTTALRQRAEAINPQTQVASPLSLESISVEEPSAAIAAAPQNEPVSVAPPAVAEERAQAGRAVEAQTQQSTALVAPESANIVQAIAASVEQIDPAAAQQVTSSDVAVNEVEEVVVTGSFVRSNSGFRAASPATQISQDSQANIIQFTEESRNQYVSVLNRVLINSDEPESADNVIMNAIVYSPESVDAIISAYNELESAAELTAANNRYAQARSNFTEYELPENLEAAIQLLQLMRSESNPN